MIIIEVDELFDPEPPVPSTTIRTVVVMQNVKTFGSINSNETMIEFVDGEVLHIAESYDSFLARLIRQPFVSAIVFPK